MGYGVDGLYYFDLSLDEQARNNELIAFFGASNCVVFGGIVLPVQGVVSKQTRHDIRARNWLNKEALGKKKTLHTERRNKDGSRTVTDEVTHIQPDGTRVKETTETIFDANNEYYLFSGDPRDKSLAELFASVTPTKRGTHTISTSSSFPKQFPRSTTRTTTTLPPNSQVETISQTTEIFDLQASPQGTDSAERTTTTRRQIASNVPAVFGKPVTLTSVTGRQFVQYMGPTTTPSDLGYFNDAMKSNPLGRVPTKTDTTLADGSEEEAYEKVSYVPSNNQKITETFNVTKDPDGNLVTEKTVRIDPYIDAVANLERRNEAGQTETTNTIESPTKETSEVITKDRFGNKLSRVFTETTKDAQHQETTTVESASDGSETTRVVIRDLDKNGKEIVTETETTKKNEKIITTTRSDSFNYDDGIKTVTMSQQITDENGDTRTEEKTFKYAISQTYDTIETSKDTFDNDILHNLFTARFAYEYEFTGQMMENSLVTKIQTKNFEHQKAWAMLDLLDEQLNLGDRISMPMKRKLYEQHIRIFTGNKGTPVLGGPVLDRIALNVWGEIVSLGCVFSPQSGFHTEWIPGTERLYSWILNAQVYTNIQSHADQFAFGEDLSPWEFANVDYLPSDYDQVVP